MAELADDVVYSNDEDQSTTGPVPRCAKCVSRDRSEGAGMWCHVAAVRGLALWNTFRAQTKTQKQL